MFGKHFESMYEGSMYGAGLHVFAVWGYIIAHVRRGRVELNPKRIADTLGGVIEDVEDAVRVLQQPDPKSRCKEFDGRRLIKEGEFQYFLPTWERYQGIRNADERREYNKMKQREYRAKKKRASAATAEGAFVKAGTPEGEDGVLEEEQKLRAKA